MTALYFILSHYSVIILLVGFCFLLGNRLLLSLSFHSVWESATYSIILGMGITAYLVFFVGLAGWLYPWVIAILAIGILAAVLFTHPNLSTTLALLRRRTREKAAVDKISLLLSGSLIIIGITGSLLALYPPTGWDAIEYHLAAAKIYVQSNAIVFTPYLRYPVSPQLNQMLFTLMLLVSDDISAQLVQYTFYILIATLIFAFGKKYLSGWTGLFAALLWLGYPAAIEVNHIAYIDLGLVLFGTAGLFAFIHYLEQHDTKWLLLSAVMLGFAACVKYPALFWVLLCGISTLWIAVRTRSIRPPLLFGLVIVAVILPFYLRNYYYSGNPFFPYLHSIFGGRIWEAVDFNELDIEQASFGVPKTLSGFLQLPGSLINEPLKFQSAGRAFHPVNYVFLIVGLALGIIRPRLRKLIVFAVSYTLFWFFTPQVLRYLLPAAPVYCLIIAAAISELTAWVQGVIIKKAPPALFERLNLWTNAAICLFLVLYAGHINIDTLIEMGELPATAESREKYLEHKLVSYNAYRLLNQEYGSNYRIYALFDENMTYYADGVFMGDWFGPARFGQFYGVLQNGEALYQQLRSLEADHFLYHDARNDGFSLPNDRYFQEHFKMIYDQEGIQLFKLVIPQE